MAGPIASQGGPGLLSIIYFNAGSFDFTIIMLLFFSKKNDTIGFWIKAIVLEDWNAGKFNLPYTVQCTYMYM